MLGGWWASKIFFTHKRGASSTFRLRFTLLSRTGVQSPGRFELRKAPKEAVDSGFVSFSPFQEACPDLFLSRALPAAGCDSKLSLGSGMQSSELSRQSLAYPCPTEINLARPVRTPRRCLFLSLFFSVLGWWAGVRKVASLASAPLRKYNPTWRLCCSVVLPHGPKRWSQSPSPTLTPSGDVSNVYRVDPV